MRAWFDRWFIRITSIHFTVKNIVAAKTFAMGASNVVYAEWDLEETTQEGTTYHLTGMTALYIEGGKAKLVKDYIFDQNVIEEIWSKQEAASSQLTPPTSRRHPLATLTGRLVYVVDVDELRRSHHDPGLGRPAMP